MNKIIALILIAMTSGIAQAHGLSPSRLEAPSGSKFVAYRFTAYNLYKEAQEFDVECFKEDFDNRIECRSIPANFWVPAKGQRNVKIQIDTGGKDGVYLACTIQAQPQGIIQTRVCARIGVGVSAAVPANGSRKRNASTGSAISAGAGSNKGG